MPSVMIHGVLTQLTMGDAPGAVMPNGDFLLSFSPPVNAPNYPPPTYIYDFNPTTNVYTDLTPQVNATGFDLSDNSFVDDMLVLPTGQMWLTI